MPNGCEAYKAMFIKTHLRLPNGFSCRMTLHLYKFILCRQNLICCRQD